MSHLSDRRAAAISGLIFVGLDAAALFLPGAPPKASDSARHIAATLATHRWQVLVGMYLAGLALIALLLFLGAVRTWLARAGADEGVRTAAFGGAIVGITAQLVGMLLFYGAAFKVAGQHQDALVRGLTDAGNASVEIGKFGFAAFIAGVCLASRGVVGAGRPALLGRWLYGAGLGSAVVLVVSAMPLFSEGQFTQFGGGLDLVGSVPGIVWIALLSVLLSRPAGRGGSVGLSTLSRSHSGLLEGEKA